MRRALHFAALLASIAGPAAHAAAVVELHDRVRADHGTGPAPVAITLDACGGGYDARLVALLIERRVPATLFVTRRWLDRHPAAARELLAHPDLFELEDHGTAHVPAVVGRDARLYGMAGQPDAAHVQREVAGAAERIKALSGRAPKYFRGAGAAYDALGRQTIEDMGYRIAGFSLNADAGATLSAAAVATRLRAARPGDVVIAHMNKPGSGTAAGFAAALPDLQRRGLRFARLSQVELERVR